MRNILIIILISTSTALSSWAQFTSSIVGGNWGSALTTWGNIFGNVPEAGDNVTIFQIGGSVSVTNIRACNNLNINGTIEVDGGTLDVNNNLNLNSPGTLEISDGSVNVDGNLNYNGTLDIDTPTGNYLEVNGDVYNNGNLRWQTNSGSIRIYSELAF